MGQWIERVYAEHRQGLFSLALAIVGVREDAEDAVHEAFARLCRVSTNGIGRSNGLCVRGRAECGLGPRAEQPGGIEGG